MLDDYDFWLSPGRKEYVKYLKPNPFQDSIIKQEMYHGNEVKGLTKIKRPIWLTALPEWCRLTHLPQVPDHGQVYACWINIVNPYFPTHDDLDEYFYDPEFSRLSFFSKLKKKGYDSYIQRGESDSIYVFKNVGIINALTGKRM